ncbi:MAG: sensor histidine kinase KdpD [Anaerolineae bacterium]|nr:sensor histidine kinase KdpD [Anaerolineae bacterium]
MAANDGERRPLPEALLTAAQQEQRGQLKIFLGAAPGVGKTYTMLEAAQAKRREGVDVVVGLVETHGRAETQALLEGLEVVPRRQIEYRGRRLTEMDLDAILARHPTLALVDELAHTNVEGSRHPKRYLDVEELLAAGINVFTTMNIQHLESLNDVVAQITGVRVRETVPDRLLERADEIELVDLAPDELLQRLREGKVYVPDQAERAIRHYFRKGNLTALRELALRHTAQRVDAQMRNYMQAHAIPGPWPTQDRIMACVSESPLAPRLIRAAKRRADRRRAEWLAVYVETPAHYRLSEGERDRVASTLRLAEQLGGEAVSIPGQEVAQDLVRYAQSRNVTELIIGKSLHSRWHEMLHGSVVHDVIRASGEIDVYVITGEPETGQTRPSSPLQAPSVVTVNAYLSSAVAVLLAGVLAAFLRSILSLPNLSTIFLTAVLFSAATWGLGPSIFASVLSIALYDFFFVDPVHTLTIASPQDVLALVIFLIVAVLTSNLAGRARDQADAARRREARTSALYNLSREIVGAAHLPSAAQAIAVQVAQTQAARVVVLTPEAGRLEVRAVQPPDVALTEAEHAAATWAWQRGQPTGHGADTLPGVDWFFQPLRAASGVVGVLGVRLEGDALLAPGQRRLLEAMSDQAAVAIERTLLAQDIEQTRLLTETERLRTALLSSISHDLRTPLASITGAVSSLLSQETAYTPTERRDLLLTVQEEADRLNRFVGNLLDMTRLESGALELNRDWVEVEDVIGAALARPAQFLGDHRLVVEVEPGLPLLSLDFVLMEQVLVNLLDNAAKYSPPGTTIQVQAHQEPGAVVLEIADEGPGIPPDQLERIFDKFHRVVDGDRRGAGAGLGLSICRGIVEAHAGTIEAQNRLDRAGALFRVRFPLTQTPPRLQEVVTHD